MRLGLVFPHGSPFRQTRTAGLSVGVALLALALAVVLITSRSGSGDSAHAEMVRLAEEATSIAAAEAPGSVLYLLAYAGGSGLYTFRFNDSIHSRDVVVTGPNNEPGALRWEVTQQEAPSADRPPPLDVRIVQKSARAILKAAASASGASEWSIGVHLAAERTSGDLVWVASVALPTPGNQGTGPPNRLRSIRCEVDDAASVSSIKCQ